MRQANLFEAWMQELCAHPRAPASANILLSSSNQIRLSRVRSGWNVSLSEGGAACRAEFRLASMSGRPDPLVLEALVLLDEPQGQWHTLLIFAFVAGLVA
jgi:hypothetical protein